MSASLTLATPDHIDRMDGLVAAFHAESGIEMGSDARRAAIMPLLEGVPHGAAYLIGPPRAPIGYVVVSFGWSLSAGGMTGAIDEIFVRPGVRGRGIASETLQSLPRALAAAGLRSLDLEVPRGGERILRICTRAGFTQRPDSTLLSRRY